jgi:hypothetical protein
MQRFINAWKHGSLRDRAFISLVPIGLVCCVCFFCVPLLSRSTPSAATPVAGVSSTAPSTSVPVSQLEATITARVLATLTAITPKDSQTPADSATQVATVVIAATATPAPTNTRQPSTSTPTPQPSDTARPSSTPTTPPKATATPKPTVPQAFSFGDGTQVVGTDIRPGTYRSMGSDSCYWERLSGFGGTLGEIVANENPVGPVIVTISASDKGFSSSRCSRWTQDLSPITSSPAAPFGDGTFFVNKDIAPGTWRSNGADSCYWARLKGFSGELKDIIANGNTSTPTVVTIGSGDGGFTSHDCGTWTKIG